jgi:uncharacterized protein (TIGR03083 family)
MDHNELIDVIEEESARLAEAARHRPDAVPAFYPDWTSTDLVAHTGRMFHRTAAVVGRLAQEPPEPATPPSGNADSVVAWFEEGATSMVAELRAADPDAAVWGVRPDFTVGRWTVRMAIEAGVHRWDAESAGGRAHALDAAVAKVGIDEFATMWAPRIAYEGNLLDGKVVGLVDYDADYRIAVNLAAGGCTMIRGGGSAADATIAGSTGSLFLWLNGRVSTAELAVTGDVAAVEGLATAARGLPKAAR